MKNATPRIAIQKAIMLTPGLRHALEAALLEAGIRGGFEPKGVSLLMCGTNGECSEMELFDVEPKPRHAYPHLMTDDVYRVVQALKPGQVLSTAEIAARSKHPLSDALTKCVKSFADSGLLSNTRRGWQRVGWAEIDVDPIIANSRAA
jgi:hypothetical protein